MSSIERLFFPVQGCCRQGTCARSSWAIEPEEPVRSSLPGTCFGACFISPVCFYTVPHFIYVSIYLFIRFLRLNPSLVLIHLCFSLWIIIFFSFSFWRSAWHCRSELLKAPCFKASWRKLLVVIWSRDVNFANCDGKTRCSLLFLVCIAWKESFYLSLNLSDCIFCFLSL